jgi:PAS domain S-box-containing protein
VGNQSITQQPPALSDLPAHPAAPEQLEIVASYATDELEGDGELAAIARFAAHLCETPVAGITVAGRESDRFLAHHGSTLRKVSRNIAFSSFTMEGHDLMQVFDAAAEPRFADNPNVLGPPHIRFFAGQPLISPEGVAFGALSVIDSTPRPAGLTDLQREGLAVLAESVMLRLSGHRKQLALQREAEAREQDLRTLIDSIPAIAWSATADGEFEYFNKRMIDFTGGMDNQDGAAFHPDDVQRIRDSWQKSLETGRIYEIEHRLCRHDGEYRWMMARAVPLRDPEGNIVRWFGTAVDIHDIYAASESRDLLAKELSHRIKNIFAVIAGLVSLTARKRPELKEFAEELSAVIRALGRAHDFVRPVDSAARDNLHGLLGELFAPYGADEGARVLVEGADLAISSRAATPLALVFHELATNSAKYGALAKADGRVKLALSESGDRLQMRWSEQGGKSPAKNAQLKEGFGSRLVDMSITGQLGGSWERRFEEDGLVVEITVPKSAIAAG